MVDIFEIQCSINKAVSSVLGFRGAENELDSLKSLCSSLESLKLNKKLLNNGRSNDNYLKYETKEDFYQFLDNLRRLLELFCSKLIHSKSLDIQLSHLYIKIFVNIINTLKSNNYEFQYDILTFPLLKIWCEVLCLNGSNRIDLDCLKKNHEIFIEFIPLILNLYKCVKDNENLNRLLYVILEVFRNTGDNEFIYQILESLEFIPKYLDFISVYPGVISRLVNKLQDLNLILFRKSIDSMIVWFRCFLDSRKEEYCNKIKQFNTVLKSIDNKEEILEKTEESIKMIIKRFKNTRQLSVSILSIKCIEYEFLDIDLRYMMGRCILDSVYKKDELILSQIRENVANRCKRESSISFNLILRDIITRSINEDNNDSNYDFSMNSSSNSNNNDKDNKGLETFNSYMVLREYLSWEIDHYLVLKFLINNVQIDFSGVDEKLVLNKKYLIDTPSSVPDNIFEKLQEIETISSKYFDTLSIELKLESFFNLLSVYKNSINPKFNLKILYLMNEIVNSFYFNNNDNTNSNYSTTTSSCSGTSSNKEFVGDLSLCDGLWELKSVIVNENMFEKLNNIDDIFVVNLTKIKIMDLLTVLIRNCKRGDLCHKDIEIMLFNIIPEYNSDYIRVYQSSSKLLSELNRYFSKFIDNQRIDVIVDENCQEPSGNYNDYKNCKELTINYKEQSGNFKETLGNYNDCNDGIDDKDSTNLQNLLEYYTNGLTKRIIYSISNEGISDLVYSLTNFNNKSFDMKVVFDLTVQFSKYFDSLCQELPEYSQEVDMNLDKDLESCYNKLIKIFYSFNYIITYVNKYYNYQMDLNYINNRYGKIEDSKKIKENKNVDEVEEIKDDRTKEVEEGETEDQLKEKKDKGQQEQEMMDEMEDDDGKGDYILSTSTLMITRSRYYVFSKNVTVKYLSLLVLYRGLVSISSNEYIFRIRVHEVWDCINHSLELNLNHLRVVTVLLEIFQLISIKIFYFIEKRLMNIFEHLEQIVLNEDQVVGVADERNSTIRYKCYLAIVKFTEEISNKVNNRLLFSKIMLISIKIYNPKTCETIKEKLNQIFLNLSKKDPTLVRNVLLEINKGDNMNTSFIKYAFKKDLKILFNKIPPQKILLDLPIIN